MWLGWASGKHWRETGGLGQAPPLPPLCWGRSADKGCVSSVAAVSSRHVLHDISFHLVVLGPGLWGSLCLSSPGKIEASCWCLSWSCFTFPYLASWLFSYTSNKFPVLNPVWNLQGWLLFDWLYPQWHTMNSSSAGKESACNTGDLGSIPGLRRSPGEGKGYPLQYSGLENSMDCPWGHKESDMTERLSLSPSVTQELSCCWWRKTV